MTTLHEAAEQALEALIDAARHMHPAFVQHAAIQTLRQALEAELVPDCHQLGQQDEPVASASAWFALVMNAAAEIEDASNCLQDADAKRVATSAAKHYRNAANALYTRSQPTAQWVGLTDGEIRATEELFSNEFGFESKHAQDFARAIEAEVLKKNVNSDLNLNCKSVQRRLATQWGFVPKQTVTYNPNRNVQPPQYQIVSER